MIRISTGLRAGPSRRAASLRSHHPRGESSRLVVVDWMPPYLGWDDAIEMIFDAGTVDENDLAYWSLQSTEIKAVALVDLATAGEF